MVTLSIVLNGVHIEFWSLTLSLTKCERFVNLRWVRLGRSDTETIIKLVNHIIEIYVWLLGWIVLRLELQKLIIVNRITRNSLFDTICFVKLLLKLTKYDVIHVSLQSDLTLYVPNCIDIYLKRHNRILVHYLFKLFRLLDR